MELKRRNSVDICFTDEELWHLDKTWEILHSLYVGLREIKNDCASVDMPISPKDIIDCCNVITAVSNNDDHTYIF